MSNIAIRVKPILPRPPQAARMVGHRPRLRSSKKIALWGLVIFGVLFAVWAVLLQGFRRPEGNRDFLSQIPSHSRMLARRGQVPKLSTDWRERVKSPQPP